MGGNTKKASILHIGKSIIIKPKTNDATYVIDFKINDIDIFEQNMRYYLNTVKSNKIKSTSIDKKHSELYFMFELWKNATFQDFSNPEKFILRYAQFIRDTTFSEFDKITSLGNYNGSYLTIQRCQADYGFETPYILNLALTADKNYYLPCIRYGISYNKSGEKLAYIYAVQESKQSMNNPPPKSFFEPLKRGVHKYRNASPHALVSLTVFLGMLDGEGIKAIKLPDFLIARYGRFFNVTSEEETDLIQRNLTERFITNFLRLSEHLDNLHIEPVDLSDLNSFVCISLDERTKFNNTAIHQLYKLGKDAVLAKNKSSSKSDHTANSNGSKFSDYEIFK